MPENEIAKHARVARTFQNIRLFGGMTVLENLHRRPAQQADARLRLLDRRHPRPGRLSRRPPGGDRQGALLAGAGRPRRPRRRSGRQPALWRPAAAGDRPRHVHRSRCCSASTSRPPASTRASRPSSTSCSASSATSTASRVLLIEHDMGVVMEISDHIVVLDYGEKISDGAAEFVRNDPKVIAAYLGVEDEEVDAGRGGGRRNERAPALRPRRRRPITATSSRCAASTSRSTRARSSP